MPDFPIIAIDAMGGDFGPEVTVAAAANILKRRKDVKLILVGLEEQIRQQMMQLHLQESDRLSVVHASEIVAMDEAPSQALRKKKTPRCVWQSTWYPTVLPVRQLVPAIPVP